MPPPNSLQRIARPRVAPRDSEVVFRFDGCEVHGLAGESVAAALTAAGIYGIRDNGRGGMRGLYCGMGACFECVVTINGKTGQRACMHALRGGEDIRSSMPAGTIGDPLKPLTPVPVGSRTPERECDLLIIGAGPAGLNAALAAGQAGAGVIVLDERSDAGGQYFKPVASSHTVSRWPDRQFAHGVALLDAVKACGAEVIVGANVWGAFAVNEIMALVKDEAIVFRPKRLVLATGAFEQPVPVPGWTLPGVMTTGAMQTLARSYQIKPGRRIVIAGNGPLNFQLAADLASHGVEIVALAEFAPRPRDPRALWRALYSGPREMLDGLGYLATLARHRTPVLWGHRVLEVAGRKGVEMVTLGSSEGDERTIQCDSVALGYGFFASLEIANALGCKLVDDPRSFGGFAGGNRRRWPHKFAKCICCRRWCQDRGCRGCWPARL